MNGAKVMRGVVRRAGAATMAVALLGVAVACTAEPRHATGPRPDVAPLTARVPAPSLHWHRCPRLPGGISPDTAGLECAELSVPRDYRAPQGKHLDIAVSRLSTGADKPVLLSNPGGPGASGLFNTLGVDALTERRLRDRFDLVGFDPRGVNRSSPVSCGLTQAQAIGATGGSAPTTFGADARAARTVARACGRNAGDELASVTTTNTARDIELLRKALRRERVSFVGTSYGAELAVRYASLYPDGTDRVVLDSPSDLTVPARQARQEEAAVAAKRFDDVAAAIARRDDEWHLGATASAVRERYLRLLARLDERPRSFGGQTVDAAALQSARVVPALDDDAYVEPLALTLAHLTGAPGALGADELTRRLREVDERGGSGLVNGQRIEGLVSANLAVTCGDDAWPRDEQVYRDAVVSEQRRFPVTRGQFSNISPCAYWPVRPAHERVELTDAGWSGPANTLILAHEGDYRAPAEGVEATRRALGSRAVTISRDGYRHGVLGSDACATDAAVAWLTGDDDAGEFADDTAKRGCPAG